MPSAWKGSVRELALRRHAFGRNAEPFGCHRRALEAGMGGKELGNLLGAFLRLERAGAVDQEPLRPQQAGGVGEQALLQAGHAGNIVGHFQPQDVGVATDGSRRGTGGHRERRRRSKCPAPRWQRRR
jgi:hypothetical protein